MEYPPFDNFMPSTDGLIRECISMFGDLPDEWAKDCPVMAATGM